MYVYLILCSSLCKVEQAASGLKRVSLFVKFKLFLCSNVINRIHKLIDSNLIKEHGRSSRKYIIKSGVIYVYELIVYILEIQ